MLHTRKSFSKLCGITENQLAVYVGRNKVIEIDKKIDDTLPENREFMEKREEKIDKKSVKVIVKPSPQTKEEKQEFEKKIKEADRRSIQNSKIKELEISKTTEEIEILRAKREKLEAFLIPIDIVKQIFAQHSKSITISFQQAGENLLIEISKKKS